MGAGSGPSPHFLVHRADWCPDRAVTMDFSATSAQIVPVLLVVLATGGMSRCAGGALAEPSVITMIALSTSPVVDTTLSFHQYATFRQLPHVPLYMCDAVARVGQVHPILWRIHLTVWAMEGPPVEHGRHILSRANLRLFLAAHLVDVREPREPRPVRGERRQDEHEPRPAPRLTPSSASSARTPQSASPPPSLRAPPA